MAPLFCEPCAARGEDLAVEVRIYSICSVQHGFNSHVHKCRLFTIPGDDVGEGLGLDLA